jgi:hypothetical protein
MPDVGWMPLSTLRRGSEGCEVFIHRLFTRLSQRVKGLRRSPQEDRSFIALVLLIARSDKVLMRKVNGEIESGE